MKKFTSAKDHGPAPERTFQFALDDEPFTVTLRSDADSALEWSELSEVAVLEGDSDIESPEGGAFVARFFKATMDAAEYRRLRGHMRKHHTDQEVLVDIMDVIQSEMQSFYEAVADRPTEPSSRSQSGPTATGARTLEIASLPDGDVEFVGGPAPIAAAPSRTTRKRKAG